MFGFGLKKTQVWVTMTLLLLLSFSICPHWGYPHAEEDEEDTLLEVEENQEGHDKDQEQLAHDEEDEDHNSSEDEGDLAEDNVENEPDCIGFGEPCSITDPKGLKCCGQTYCESYKGGPLQCLRKTKDGTVAPPPSKDEVLKK